MLNEYFERLISHAIAPYLALTLVLVIKQFELLTANQWRHFFLLSVFLCLQILPVLYGKVNSMDRHQSQTRRFTWWILAFVGWPLLSLALAQQLNGYLPIFTAAYQHVLWLWLLEGVLLSKHRLVLPIMTKMKFTPTIDNVLFIILLAFSLFWALVFNSIDNPVENQPINIVIDIKRNLLNIMPLLAYFAQFFTIYGCLYLVYWLNHHWLVNRVLARFGLFHYLWLALIFGLIAVPALAQLVLLLPINSVDFTFLPSQNYDPFDEWNYRIGFTVLAMSLPLILAFKWQEQSKQMADLEKEKVKNELLWLQQQINPHFLFNTLNNLYSLTLTKSEQAPEMVLQLANLLRFVVYQGSKEQVLLKDELDYLKGYLTLQQIRVSHKCEFHVQFPQCLPELAIAPLLLINLIENAFKHGIEPSNEPSELAITLQIDDNTLYFCCKNTLAKSYQPAETGIGLQNMQRRLELLYPNRHTLTLVQQHHYYVATLTLELSK